MSVDAALASTAVLALLIAWLQTKVELRIRRKNGKTEVDFTISKQAASDQVIRNIAATFRSVLGISAVGKSAPPAPLSHDGRDPAREARAQPPSRFRTPGLGGGAPPR